MIDKTIAGTKGYRAFSDKYGERIYIENTRTKNLMEIKADEWDSFKLLVSITDKHLKQKGGKQ